METTTRYSAVQVVESKGLKEAVFAFESCWISQFWPPCSVHADSVLCKGVFADMLKMYDIKLCPVPPYLHQINLLEPLHASIRFIYIRLRHTEPSLSSRLLAIRAVWVSNDLYGSDFVSAYEAAKRFTCPIHPDFPPVPVDQQLLEAHANLHARRKLPAYFANNPCRPPTFALVTLFKYIHIENMKNRVSG